jgi:predicted small metal-binding protein
MPEKEIREILEKFAEHIEMSKNEWEIENAIIQNILALKDAVMKEYCQCKEKPVRLISHCRNCGKEIENPPTIKEMLEEGDDDESIELKFSFDEYSKIRGILIPTNLFKVVKSALEEVINGK